MSTQPTHHGYAVNVKDYSRYDNHAPLIFAEDLAEAVRPPATW